jgi:hypothetical protein
MATAPDGDGSRPVLPRRELTTPRSTAIAGILFAVLLTTSFVLLWLSVRAGRRTPARGCPTRAGGGASGGR